MGSAVAMTSLGIESTISSPVPTGTGSITIAHGRVSVPAPATAELLAGIPIAPSDVEHELTTPTGAAILRATATAFGPLPAMTVQAVGYGAGTKDLEGQANVLRVFIGERTDSTQSIAGVESDQVTVLETNVDDSTPQQMADCAQRLMAAGALDVVQIPCTMKKGRAAILLTVISPASKVALLEAIIFEHSSAIGIRRNIVDRHKLARHSSLVETPFGPVRGKVLQMPGGLPPRFTVEDDDARSLATSHQTTAAEVKRVATEAWAVTHPKK